MQHGNWWIGSMYIYRKPLFIADRFCFTVDSNIWKADLLARYGGVAPKMAEEAHALVIDQVWLLRSTKLLQIFVALTFMLISCTHLFPRLFKRPSTMQNCQEVIFPRSLWPLGQDLVYALEVCFCLPFVHWDVELSAHECHFHISSL